MPVNRDPNDDSPTVRAGRLGASPPPIARPPADIHAPCDALADELADRLAAVTAERDRLAAVAEAARAFIHGGTLLYDGIVFVGIDARRAIPLIDRLSREVLAVLGPAPPVPIDAARPAPGGAAE